jgi:hypothetical protein
MWEYHSIKDKKLMEKNVPKGFINGIKYTYSNFYIIIIIIWSFLAVCCNFRLSGTALIRKMQFIFLI